MGTAEVRSPKDKGMAPCIFIYCCHHFILISASFPVDTSLALSLSCKQILYTVAKEETLRGAAVGGTLYLNEIGSDDFQLLAPVSESNISILERER